MQKPAAVVGWLAPLGQLLVFLVAVMFVVSCRPTFTITSDIDVTLDAPPPVTKIPITLGVYYDADFRSNSQALFLNAGHRHIWPIGKASVTLFDQALPQLFQKVVPVSKRPPLGKDEGPVAAVMQPRIEEFDCASWPFISSVTYRITLYLPDGSSFASYLVKGKGEVSFSETWLHWDNLGVAASYALQDGVRNFMTGFLKVPEVQRWLQASGVLDAK